MTKVAIPVTDIHNAIHIRTGRAPYFAVFNVVNNSFRFERRVENPHALKQHRHGHGPHKGQASDEHRIQNHARSLQVIGECDYLLAVAVGPYMKQALQRRGIKHVKFKKSDGDTADDFMHAFMKAKEDQNWS